ncbi:hypothetical protein HPB49_008681 [Dermacentor silvarum]|uniref:Uncharacterized protein n=1 Tax=Dermacentor silvarum TaxID=543639 RepID=A0ACB8DBS3_DERSI|nr:hypothetical protein HPB49_008681 [Dermacentor silvarum]
MTADALRIGSVNNLRLLRCFTPLSQNSGLIVTAKFSAPPGYHPRQGLAPHRPGFPGVMADATKVTGYDPTSLRVVTMETTSSDQAMPSEHEYLADMVKLWQRKQSQAAAPPKGQGSRAATLPQVAASGSSTRHSPDGTRTAPPSPPRCQPKWRPRHTPRLSLWDQNVLLCSVTSLPMAQRLLGDIQLAVGDQQLPFRGHAKASGEICRAVVTFEGTKLPRFIFYHSVVAYVCPYKKTIPACSLCGTIGHRPSACPRPTPGRCTRCGTQVQVTSEGLAKHECNPTCLLCSGPASKRRSGMSREISETYTTIDLEATCTPVTGKSSGFPTQAWITSPDPGEPTADHLSALPAAFRGATSALTKQVATFQLQQQKPAGPPTAAPVVKPVDHQPSPRATPTPRTPPAPPASSTAPAAHSVTGAPQSPLSIDHTLPLEDRITRLENVVLYEISTINVQYIVAEVVQAVQAWALTQFRTRSSRSRSASTSSSSAPRRRKVAGSSYPALNPASIPLPAPQGQGQGMEIDP